MRVTRGLSLTVLAVLVWAASLFHSPSARGQDAIPSAAQLEMLKNLSAEQRDAILQQITGQGSGSVASSNDTSTRRDQAELGTGQQGTNGIDQPRTRIPGGSWMRMATNCSTRTAFPCSGEMTG